MNNHAARDPRHWSHTRHPLRRAWLRWRSPAPVVTDTLTIPPGVRFTTPADHLARSALQQKHRVALHFLRNIKPPSNYMSAGAAFYGGVSMLLKKQAE